MKVKKIYEDTDKIVKYSDKQVSDLLDNIDNTNKYLDLNQFKKLLSSNILWCALVNGNNCLALCAIKKNKLGTNDYYVNELGSFQKGAGKRLLNYILSKFDNIWLMSEPGKSELVNYYRQFGLKEFRLDDNIYKVPVYYFYKGSDKLVDLITDYYSGVA